MPASSSSSPFKSLPAPTLTIAGVYSKFSRKMFAFFAYTTITDTEHNLEFSYLDNFYDGVVEFDICAVFDSHTNSLLYGRSKFIISVTCCCQ